MNILFRVSGGRAKKKQLAMGHVYRCINLAKNLKPNRIHFLLEDFGGAKKILEENGFKRITILKAEISLKNDINKTISYIKNNKIEIIVIDHFQIKDRFLKELQKFTKVVVITDLFKKNLHADLLVNGFIGYENQILNNKYNTKCLLGPKYQILDTHFSTKEKNKKHYKILVTFGGFDEKCIMNQIFKSIIEHIQKIKIKIIIGPVSITSKNIKKIKIQNKNLKIVKSTKKMYYDISRTEFGICSGGITTYEFAAMNVPFIIICDDKHQLITANEWQKKGLAVNLGLFNKNTNRKISKILSLIENDRLKLKTADYVDGNGAKRVSNEILKML